MEKKLILYGMKIGKRELRGLVSGVVLLCYSLFGSPLYARAEMCTAGIDYNITTIAAGAWHTAGLKEDGTVVAVGSHWYGRLYDVSSWTNIKAIAADNLTIGLKEDGTVVAIGQTIYGEFDVSGWTNIKAIAAGHYHNVGLKEDGTVLAVGGNWSGQLDVSG